MRYTLALLIFIAATASAEIYKWTDANGKVHYGDNPNKGQAVEKINVDVNTFEPVTYQPVAPVADTAAGRVTMYATSWCGYCARARQYFSANNIPFVEYDIEKDERAKRMYDALGGKGVPVILFGKKRLNGFSVAGFNRIYQ